jgi:hypothetical protein
MTLGGRRAKKSLLYAVDGERRRDKHIKALEGYIEEYVKWSKIR